MHVAVAKVSWGMDRIVQTLMNAAVTYLTSATPTPCAPTPRVSTSAAVSEVTRETADIALMWMSAAQMRPMTVILMLCVKILMVPSLAAVRRVTLETAEIAQILTNVSN